MSISKLFLCLIAITVLAACSSIAPVSTPSAMVTEAATATVSPTATAKPTETATVTETSAAPEYSQDLAHPENLPETTLDVLTSPAFAAQFLADAAAGKLPSAPSTAKPAPIIVDYDTYESKNMLKDEGFTDLFTLNVVKAGTMGIDPTNLAERFNYVAAAYKIPDLSGDVYAVIMGYVNPNSQPDGYLGFLFKPDDPANAAQELADRFPGDMQSEMTSGDLFANTDKEKAIMAAYFGSSENSDTVFTKWYFDALANNPESCFS